MKRRKTTIFGMACGIVCAACVFAYLQGVRGEADIERAEALARYGGEQLEVCVAKRDVAAGETLDAGSVETRLWVTDLLPSEAIRDLDDVVGRKASSTILAGEVLSERRFKDADSQLNIPEGLTAVSVPAKDVQAVGGAVSAGLRTDLYATGDTTTELVANDVIVLATSAGSVGETRDAAVSWITIAVEPESVQEIVSAAQRAELYFTLPGSASLSRSDAHASNQVSKVVAAPTGGGNEGEDG